MVSFRRLHAFAGIGFTLLLLATVAVSGHETPEFGAPVAEWSGYAREHGDDARLALLIVAFAAFAFLVFLGALRERIGRGGHAVLAGGAIGIAGLVLGVGLAAAATAHPEASPEVIRAVNDASGVGFALAQPGFAVMLITTFLVARPGRALPAGLGRLALVAGLCFLLQLVTLLSDEYDNAFGIFYPLGFLGLMLFAVGASVTFLRGAAGESPAPGANR